MSISSKKLNFVLSAAALSLVVGLAASSPVSAQTTTSTAPDTVLDKMNAGVNDIDDIAGMAAAVGISSVVFGGGAMIFKRFIYS
jgi:hypothetical protein